MEHGTMWQKIYQVEARRLVVVVVILASIILLFQLFSLPRSVLVSFMPASNVAVAVQNSFGSGDSSLKSVGFGDHPLLNDPVTATDSLEFSFSNKSETVSTDENPREIHEIKRPGLGFPFKKGPDRDGDFEVHKDRDLIHNSSLGADFGIQIPLPDVGRPANAAATIGTRHDSIFASERTEGEANVVIMSLPGKVSPSISTKSHSMLANVDAGPSNPDTPVDSKTSSMTELPLKGTRLKFQKNVSTSLSDNSSLAGIPVLKKKKGGLPPISISQMNHILLQQYTSSHSKKLRRPSARERELLSAKAEIEHAPILEDDPHLYSPVFRNISMFKRSYELMERMLKVYVYKDGEKPIFHQPLLKGIYASEGWFMKLMERNRHFTVKDPRKAHLFYLPFSTRMLQLTLYVSHSRNRKYLADYLQNYVDRLAAKYPFWNRTRGADHFLVACHDWASYETRHQLESTIRALCNADLSGGFKLGKDVSLPETYVRSSGNPLEGLGGNPVNQRPTLAFYAGGVHGYLRQALLLYWENKDPDMKIFGPKFFGIETKKVYIEHMKTSKYCICPRGYEVNSPRIVEAIFYECVPVILSDNFVPPLFEVLDWETFAVFVAEKDIPKLKDILLSIPKEKYLTMQMRVKKVQKHFLWNPNPVKYDLFHMILHSVWFNRLNQIRIT
ncbi:probable glycosyltransferase At3g07620 [Aristolochia californica]|uniref:probable glycosyltransferase At3g07620 n=1 Tax=Aristolochia californica TaxID=171875 RepID=UPI0035E2B34D